MMLRFERYEFLGMLKEWAETCRERAARTREAMKEQPEWYPSQISMGQSIGADLDEHDARDYLYMAEHLPEGDVLMDHREFFKMRR